MTKFLFKNVLAGTCLIIFIIQRATAEKIINTPIVTTFGGWEKWEHCPNFTYVTAVDVATEELKLEQRNTKDKTGLISVVFQCSYPKTPNIPESFIYTIVGGVQSSVPDYKSKSPSVGISQVNITYSLPLRTACDGVVIGAQLMNHEEQKALDNVGAANLRILCSDRAEDDQAYVEAYGIYEGEWNEPAICGPRQVICGVQTLSKRLDGAIDESGVNALRFKCCDIPNPASLCQPKEQWELVQECDNKMSAVAYLCAYARKVGVTTISTGADVDPIEREFYEQIGYSTEKSPFLLINALRNNFAGALGQSSISDALDWAATGLEIWNLEAAEDVTSHSVPPEHRVKVYQLVGTCGYLSVRTPVFRQTTI